MMMYPKTHVTHHAINLLVTGVFVYLNGNTSMAQTVAVLTPEQQSQAMQRQQLALSVIINGESTRWVTDFIQRDADLWASLADLELIGIRTDGLIPSTTDQLIALSAIPGLRYRYLSSTQEIAFQVEDSRLVPHKLGGYSDHPLKPTTPGTGFLFNYDAYTQYDGRDNKQKFNLFTEGRFFHNDSYLSNTGLFSHAKNSSRYIRLDTSWTYSFPKTLKTLQAGDMISSSLNWSRSVRLGGLKISRNFSLRPDLITFPVPQLTGSAAVPSSVDLYVNNIRHYSGQVPSGPFVLNNGPQISGAGEATIVVRDALGRDVVTKIPLYIDSRLLRSGLVDYSAELGFMREQYGTHSFEYGNRLAGSGSIRYGYSDSITVEGHAEGMSGVYMAGGSTFIGLGQHGVANIAAAASTGSGSSGQMLMLGYQKNTPHYVIDLQGKRTFGNFKDLSTVAGSPFPKELYQTTVGIPIKQHSSIAMSYIYMNNSNGNVKNDNKLSRLGTIGFNAQLPKGISLNLSAYKDFANPKSKGVYMSLSIGLGASTSSSFTAASDNGKTSYSATATRTANYEGGVGWHIEAGRTHHMNRVLGRLSYLGRYGELIGAVQQFDSNTSASLQASGSLVVMDGGVLPGRRISQSFALVSTNGNPDIPILHENRKIGVTNSKGHFLIPDLTAYNTNKIAIDPLDLPANVRTSPPTQWISPAQQAGSLVKFDIEKFRGGQATLVDKDMQPLPPGTPVTLVETGAKTVVGYDGAIFFETWEKRNTIEAKLPQGKCLAMVDYPEKINGSIPVLGKMICQPEVAP